MSMMMPPGAPPAGPGLGGPAPSAIQIGGPNHGQPVQDGPGDPDSGGVVAKLKAALKLLQDAANLEGDDVDAGNLHTIAASIAKAIGAEQGLADKAMGAGPGVKLVRKATGGV